MPKRPFEAANDVPSTSSKCTENGSVTNSDVIEGVSAPKKKRSFESDDLPNSLSKSTETEIVTNSDYIDGGSAPKKCAVEYNFWENEAENDDSVVPVKSYLKINELTCGKMIGKLLTLRIAYLSEVRNTRIGNVISFHGIDETGQIALVTYGKNCEFVSNFIKVKLSLINNADCCVINASCFRSTICIVSTIIPLPKKIPLIQVVLGIAYK